MRQKELIYLLNSKAMKPKSNVSITPNAYLKITFDKGPHSTLRINQIKLNKEYSDLDSNLESDTD